MNFCELTPGRIINLEQIVQLKVNLATSTRVDLTLTCTGATFCVTLTLAQFEDLKRAMGLI